MTPRRPARSPTAAEDHPHADPVIRWMLAAFLVIQILEIVSSGPARYPDTDTYRVPGSFLDFSLSSLSGRSVRPWGVTAWMALWPSDQAIVVAQTALSIIAWSVLALTAAAGIRRTGLRRMVVGLLLLVGCTAQVASWQLAILGESVSISTGVLALALAIRWVRKPSWARTVSFLLVALWFTMTRPNIFPVLLAWAVAALVFGLRRRPGPATRPSRVLVGTITAGALLAFSLYSYAYNIRADPAWRASPEFGVSRSTVAFGYPVSANGPEANAVIRDLRRSDAPRCMIPASPSDVSDHGTTRWVQQTAASCPGMDAWASAHWNSWWLHWLITHPLRTLHIIATELPYSLSPPVWTAITAAVPMSVSSLVFGASGLPQSAIPGRTFGTQPLLIWLALAVGLAWWGRQRLRARASGPGLVLVATIAGALASAVSSGLLIQTAPFEVGQESAGVTILLTAALIILIGVLVDRLRPGPTGEGTDLPG